MLSSCLSYAERPSLNGANEPSFPSGSPEPGTDRYRRPIPARVNCNIAEEGTTLTRRDGRKYENDLLPQGVATARHCNTPSPANTVTEVSGPKVHLEAIRGPPLLGKYKLPLPSDGQGPLQGCGEGKDHRRRDEETRPSELEVTGEG